MRTHVLFAAFAALLLLPLASAVTIPPGVTQTVPDQNKGQTVPTETTSVCDILGCGGSGGQIGPYSTPPVTPGCVVVTCLNPIPSIPLVPAIPINYCATGPLVVMCQEFTVQGFAVGVQTTGVGVAASNIGQFVTLGAIPTPVGTVCDPAAPVHCTVLAVPDVATLGTVEITWTLLGQPEGVIVHLDHPTG